MGEIAFIYAKVFDTLSANQNIILNDPKQRVVLVDCNPMISLPEKLSSCPTLTLYPRSKQ